MNTHHTAPIYALCLTLFVFLGINKIAAQEKPTLHIQRGNQGTIHLAAFSPDSRILATTGEEDKEIHLWDIQTAREIATLSGHASMVNNLVFHTATGYLISTDDDAFKPQLIIWDWQKGKILQSFGVKSSETHFYFSRDQSYLLVVSGGIVAYMFKTKKEWERFWREEAKLYRVDAQGLQPVSLTAPAQMSALGFDPICVSKEEGKGYLDIITRKPCKNLPPAEQKVLYWQDVWKYDYDVAGNRKLIAKATADREIQLFDFDTDFTKETTPRKTLSGQQARITLLRFNQDGSLLASATRDDSLKIWDTQSGRVIRHLRNNASAQNCVRFSPDGKSLVSGGDDGCIKVWDLAQGKLLSQFEHLNAVYEVCFAPDGNTLASAAADRTLRLWDWRTARALQVYKKEIHPRPSTQYGYSIGFHPTKPELYYAAVSERKFGSGFTAQYRNVGVFSAWDTNTGEMLSTRAMLDDVGDRYLLKPFMLGFRSNPRGDVWSFGGFMSIAPDFLEDFFLAGERASSLPDIEAYPFGANTDGDKWLIIVNGGEGSMLSLVGLKPNPDDNKSLAKINLSEIGINQPQTAALLPDASACFVGDAQGNIYKIRITTDKFELIATWTAHNYGVRGMDISPDGRLLASAGADGLIKLWDTNTGTLLLSILPMKHSDEYVWYTPDNYYTATKGGTDALHFLKEGRAYSFDQFDLQYNRPDKILERLGVADAATIEVYKRAYEKRLQRQGFQMPSPSSPNAAPNIGNVPEIWLANREQYFQQTNTATYTLKISAKDTQHALTRLHVWVNGVPYFGSKGKTLTTPQNTPTTLEESIQLRRGANIVEVSVQNEQGSESARERLELFYIPDKANPKTDLPNLYLVSIGVGNFQNAKMNLNYAVKDSRDLANLFTQQPEIKQQFDQIITLQLFDKEATKENVLRLKDQLQRSTPDDYVLVFISTHGLLDNRLEYYLAMYDVDFDKPQARGLRYEELENLLDGIASQHKLLLIDACHSGEVDTDNSIANNADWKAGSKGVRQVKTFNAPKQPTSPAPVKTKSGQKDANKTANENPLEDLGTEALENGNISLKNSFVLMQELFGNVKRGTGATVISAAAGNEYALEGAEWNNGVFTYALLSGLREQRADLNRDGRIRLSELKKYVQRVVPELTRGKQQPTSRSENLVNDFRIK